MHTAESSLALGNPLQSWAPWFASHLEVELHSVYPTVESSSAVCFPMPSQALQCALHRQVKCTKFFFKNLWCASYHEVKLPGVHPNLESSSAVWITPRSQTAHLEVKMEIFVRLWLLLKGQSGEIFLRVNTSIMKEKIWRKIFWLAKPKILIQQCDTPRNQIFWTLWLNILAKSKPK